MTLDRAYCSAAQLCSANKPERAGKAGWLSRTRGRGVRMRIDERARSNPIYVRAVLFA
jgi:hypothetical protein